MLRRTTRLFITLCIICSPMIVKVAYTCSIAPLVTHTYLSWTDFRQTITIEPSRDLTTPGGILMYQDLLLVVDDKTGIHLYDNADKTSPSSIGFLPIPGASQLSIRNDYLYVSSYTDLVVIDISSPESSAEISRSEFAFDVPFDQEQGVITETVYEYPENSQNICGSRRSSSGCSGSSPADQIPASDTVSPANNIGQSGSTASMIIVEDHLYVISGWSILTLSLSDPTSPAIVDEQVTNFIYETLYFHDNALYFGSSIGVYIYDLTDPAQPMFVSQFEHQWQCDPVVVQGSIAFSTLRSGRGCGGTLDQLDILNVEDLQNPTLIKSHDFHNPYGLAIEGTTLFIADNSTGLKILSFTPPGDIELLHTLLTVNPTQNLPAFPAHDVIVNNGEGIYVGPNGLVQFDYSDLDNIVILSWIEASAPSPGT